MSYVRLVSARIRCDKCGRFVAEAAVDGFDPRRHRHFCVLCTLRLEAERAPITGSRPGCAA